jgi:hypothetical protein
MGKDQEGWIKNRGGGTRQDFLDRLWFFLKFGCWLVISDFYTIIGRAFDLNAN